MYVEHNIGTRSLNHCCRGKESSKYYECVCVCVCVCVIALLIRHAKRVFSASYYTSIVVCGLTGCTVFFATLSHKMYDFRGRKKN